MRLHPNYPNCSHLKPVFYILPIH